MTIPVDPTTIGVVPPQVLYKDEAVQFPPKTYPVKSAETRPDVRVKAIQATDVILAALQAAFGQDKLFNGANPLRFLRDDPKGSRVWVCDPESRTDERDGNQMIVMVARGEYQPQELHLYNAAGANFDGKEDFSDLAQTPIFISCESGTKTSSEVLASIVYDVLKIFRKQLMAQYDIHSIKLSSITAPMKQKDVAGNPWITVVNVRIETQEHIQMTELSNHMNMIDVDIEVTKNVERAFLVLDATPNYDTVPS